MFVQIHCFSSDDLSNCINFLNNNFEFETAEAIVFISAGVRTEIQKSPKIDDELVAFLIRHFKQEEDNVGLYFKPTERYLRIHIYKSAKTNPQNF